MRVLTRLIVQTQQKYNLKVAGFKNHKRVAKRRMLTVMNAKNKKQRKQGYVDLLNITGKVLEYAHTALETICQKTIAAKTLSL